MREYCGLKVVVSVVKVQSCSCAPDTNYQQLLAESGNRQPEQLKCGKVAELRTPATASSKLYQSDIRILELQD